METNHVLSVLKVLGIIKMAKHHVHHVQLAHSIIILAHSINRHAFHVQMEATAQREVLHAACVHQDYIKKKES